MCPATSTSTQQRSFKGLPLNINSDIMIMTLKSEKHQFAVVENRILAGRPKKRLMNVMLVVKVRQGAI